MEKKSKGTGVWHKIAFVDLSDRNSWVEELSEQTYEKYLGGLGLSAKILWERIEPGCNPLSEANVLCFTPGVLTDTGALFSGRFTVAGKSPASNSWGDANCGGYFSPALKRCAIDALVIMGKSEAPVYVVMDEKQVLIEDANFVWGKDTVQTEALLKDRHGKKAQIAAIGPAGERQSLISGIVTDRGRIAARGGLGAVLGAKNLKAVVACGGSKVEVANGEEILRLSREFLKRLKKLRSLEPYLNDRLLGLLGRFMRPGYVYVRQPSVLWRLLLQKFGPCSLNVMSAENGDSPVKNWSGVGYLDFPLSESQKIGADSVIRFEKKKYGCAACPLRCGGIMVVPEDWGIKEQIHKPEYETCCAFGTLLLNNDLKSIFIINDMLNRAGMDTISCGATVAFAVECFEAGLLSPKDTEGLELHWGNSQSIVKLVEMIVQRKGIGDLLADGVKVAAEKIGKGAEQYAVHCGGIEAPMHDPKIDPGFFISYSLLPAPGRHTVTGYLVREVQELEKLFPGTPKVPRLVSRKSRLTRTNERIGEMAVGTFFKMLMDCAGICLFGTQVGGQMPIVQWLNAATGRDLSPDQYLRIGERVLQLRHLFNVREGINPARDFAPHSRLRGAPPLKKGPARGVTQDYDSIAKSFYEQMHWDPQTGVSDSKYLEELGIWEEVRDFLLSGDANR